MKAYFFVQYHISDKNEEGGGGLNLPNITKLTNNNYL